MIFFFRTFIEIHRRALKSDINGGFSKVEVSYVQLFLSQSPRFSTSLTDSPYEAKAITLVHAIKDKEVHCTCRTFLVLSSRVV